MMPKEHLVEPVSFYQDILISAGDTDEHYANMFSGKLNFPSNRVPAGYELHCTNLIVFTYDVEQSISRNTQSTSKASTVIGYTPNDLKDELIFKILMNGVVSLYINGGFNKYNIDEGYLLPYYELRILDPLQINTIDFPYIIHEGENLIVLIQRPATPTAFGTDIIITSRLIGRLKQKTLIDKS